MSLESELNNLTIDQVRTAVQRLESRGLMDKESGERSGLMMDIAEYHIPALHEMMPSIADVMTRQNGDLRDRREPVDIRELWDVDKCSDGCDLVILALWELIQMEREADQSSKGNQE